MKEFQKRGIGGGFLLGYDKGMRQLVQNHDFVVFGLGAGPLNATTCACCKQAHTRAERRAFYSQYVLCVSFFCFDLTIRSNNTQRQFFCGEAWTRAPFGALFGSVESIYVCFEWDI